ncbi:hypothetical protein PanWU01x14_093360 [Parasponia andersonii]|uniref:Uncharacterized protein n=1 Tax=Parasponia andersonii TaxID=3476 RepID=A0A2P5D5Z5_PARAD|nr:hypothetical protein PanWU01x14_093360 [Parasponia andersonii]
MGNCLRKNNKILGEDVDEQESPRKLAEQAVALEQNTSTSTSHSKPEDLKDAEKKNRVRFKLQDLEEKRTIGGGRGLNDPHGDSKSGVVRIRLVVTQEELKQILNYKKNNDSKFSSVEQLLNEIKLRGSSSVFEVENKSDRGSWSPALETIPEDQ